MTPEPRKHPAAPLAPVSNRIGEVMAHIPWYGFEPQARLARDAGVSKSAVSRLLSGKTRPSFALVWALTRALERRLGTPLEMREIVSLDGTYPTPCACDLVGCRGCALSERRRADAAGCEGVPP